jgi:hypothetical protein
MLRVEYVPPTESMQSSEAALKTSGRLFLKLGRKSEVTRYDSTYEVSSGERIAPHGDHKAG